MEKLGRCPRGKPPATVRLPNLQCTLIWFIFFSVSVIRQAQTWTKGSLMCTYVIFMRTYTHGANGLGVGPRYIILSDGLFLCIPHSLRAAVNVLLWWMSMQLCPPF